MQQEKFAVKTFSDLREESLTMKRRLPKRRGRPAISLAEGSAEMAVARKAEIQAQGGEIVILPEKIQRSRES
jgi:hypothetical protein